MVYTVKRWLALNDEGKAALRQNFPALGKLLDNEKLQVITSPNSSFLA